MDSKTIVILLLTRPRVRYGQLGCWRYMANEACDVLQMTMLAECGQQGLGCFLTRPSECYGQQGWWWNMIDNAQDVL